MLVDIMLSDFTRNQSLRNTIIIILCMEWPLSVSQIYKRVIRGYGLACSYQAVFKQVKELESTKVLLKKGRYYRLNENWLSSVNRFIEGVLERYNGNPSGVIGIKPMLESNENVSGSGQKTSQITKQ